MTITAKIVADSIAENGSRITTFVLKYPRFIHSEFMTHRAFSRNASSSRAIPFEKQIKMIEEDPAMPLEFRANQKGMQAGEAIGDQKKAESYWNRAKNQAIKYAECLHRLGVHKQYVNRIIEPFSHITVVCTATEYSNFFGLRHHSMAQPEIAELARQMWDLYKVNEPQQVEMHDWHLPFMDGDTYRECTRYSRNLAKEAGHPSYAPEGWEPMDLMIKRSVARCARVSYNNHDGSSTTVEQDLQLYDRLLGAQPIHASPAEHQATPVASEVHTSGNLRGWSQYRKSLEGENITKFEEPLG